MTIAERCYQLAEQAKTSAKSMHCRANADARAAALKAASVYVMAAGWSETMTPAALAERCREQADAYLASAKPYKAGPKKSAYIRGAAVLFEVARWAEEDVVPAIAESAPSFTELVDQTDSFANQGAAAAVAMLANEIAETGRLPRRPYTRKTPPAQDAAEEAAESEATPPRTSTAAQRQSRVDEERFWKDPAAMVNDDLMRNR